MYSDSTATRDPRRWEAALQHGPWAASGPTTVADRPLLVGELSVARIYIAAAGTTVSVIINKNAYVPARTAPRESRTS